MRVVSLILSAIPFTLLPTVSAQSGWHVVSTETLATSADGVAHHVNAIARPPKGENDSADATLHFVSFEARDFTFRALDQVPHDNASVADIISGSSCIAGTNGGYFSENFDPVGLLVCDGRTVHPAQRSKLLSGMLVVHSNHIELRRVGEGSLTPGKHVRQAIQCGPFLVEDRKPVAGLNGTRSARRTAVFTDGGGRWGLVVCSPVTLEEFAMILVDASVLPAGLKISRALNFDGGGSTALWVRPPPGKGGEPFSLAERGYVRDFIGIVPRVRVPAGSRP